jgi:hypothetical protein
MIIIRHTRRYAGVRALWRVAQAAAKYSGEAKVKMPLISMF